MAAMLAGTGKRQGSKAGSQEKKHNQRFGGGITPIEKAWQRLFQRKIHD